MFIDILRNVRFMLGRLLQIVKHYKIKSPVVLNTFEIRCLI